MIFLYDWLSYDCGVVTKIYRRHNGNGISSCINQILTGMVAGNDSLYFYNIGKIFASQNNFSVHNCFYHISYGNLNNLYPTHRVRRKKIREKKGHTWIINCGMKIKTWFFLGLNPVAKSDSRSLKHCLERRTDFWHCPVPFNPRCFCGYILSDDVRHLLIT